MLEIYWGKLRNIFPSKAAIKKHMSVQMFYQPKPSLTMCVFRLEPGWVSPC